MKAKITKDLIQTIEETTKVYNEAAKSRITPVQAQKKLGIKKVIRGRGLSSFQTHKGIPASIRKEFREALFANRITKKSPGNKKVEKLESDFVPNGSGMTKKTRKRRFNPSLLTPPKFIGMFNDLPLPGRNSTIILKDYRFHTLKPDHYLKFAIEGNSSEEKKACITRLRSATSQFNKANKDFKVSLRQIENNLFGAWRVDSKNNILTEKESVIKRKKKRVNRKDWSAQEEKFLTDNFNSKSNKEIAKILGRTAFSIKSKIERMEKAGKNKKTTLAA